MGQHRPSVLFLVHIEEMFREHFPKQYDTRDDREGDGWLRLIARRARNYDRVIALCSQVQDEEPCWEITQVAHETWSWGWGYENGEIYDYDICPTEAKQWVIPSYTGYTWIPPEIRTPRWKQWSICIGGGCELECLANWCSVLEHMQLSYRQINTYVYGD